MNSELINLLRDPLDGSPLAYRDGWLQSTGGARYPVENNIPRLVPQENLSREQNQARKSFGFKWDQETSYGSEASRAFTGQWMAEKYGFATVAAVRDYLGKQSRVLDAGCGGGGALLWFGFEEPDQLPSLWLGMDISQSVDVAHKRFHEPLGASFVQGDVLHPPLATASLDVIFSEGVLHHTPSTRRAILTLAPLLKPGGEFMFYVYRKKGPVREFSDDYIRQAIADMSPDEAWEALRSLTKLGQLLADLDTTITIPEAIDVLDIPAGEINLQRFFYWHIMKVFWNEDFTFEENHHINFDWYHPMYAHRQTEAEIRVWCDEAHLQIVHLHEQPSGFTIRARRK